MQAPSVPLHQQSLVFVSDGWFPPFGHYLTNFCFSGAPALRYPPQVLPQACTLRTPRLELPFSPKVCKGWRAFCWVAAFSLHIQSLDEWFCCSHCFLSQSLPPPSLPWLNPPPLPPAWDFACSPIWPVAWVTLSGPCCQQTSFNEPVFILDLSFSLMLRFEDQTPLPSSLWNRDWNEALEHSNRNETVQAQSLGKPSLVFFSCLPHLWACRHTAEMSSSYLPSPHSFSMVRGPCSGMKSLLAIDAVLSVLMVCHQHFPNLPRRMQDNLSHENIGGCHSTFQNCPMASHCL